MDKIKMGVNVSPYPMPVVLVGTLSDGNPNFMPVGWISRVNFKPPQIAVAINRVHLTADGIKKSQTFSINFPGEDLMVKTDYCGLHSGKKVDKSKIFDVFFGELGNAPMIKECPLCIECKLSEMISGETNVVFVGEIQESYTEEKYLTDGKMDIKKMKTFVMTMPDNIYWSIGEPIGKAWGSGKEFSEQ